MFLHTGSSDLFLQIYIDSILQIRFFIFVSSCSFVFVCVFDCFLLHSLFCLILFIVYFCMRRLLRKRRVLVCCALPPLWPNGMLMHGLQRSIIGSTDKTRMMGSMMIWWGTWTRWRPHMYRCSNRWPTSKKHMRRCSSRWRKRLLRISRCSSRWPSCCSNWPSSFVQFMFVSANTWPQWGTAASVGRRRPHHRRLRRWHMQQYRRQLGPRRLRRWHRQQYRRRRVILGGSSPKATGRCDTACYAGLYYLMFVVSFIVFRRC